MSRPNEDHPYGIQLTWAADDHIAIISTEGTMEIAAIDTWAELTLRVLREWPRERKALVLFNNTGEKQAYTPYAVARTRRLYAEAPTDLYGSAAIVLRPGHLFYHLRHILQIEALRVNHRLTQRFFTSADEAYAWLLEQLPPSTLPFTDPSSQQSTQQPLPDAHSADSVVSP